MGCGASTQQHAAAAKPGTVKKLDTDTAKGTVEAKVWVGDSGADTLPFPELGGGEFHMDALAAKPDWGIALSGGGMRAATCALGSMRGLHEAGLLGKARYLSATSGGAWFSSAFSFNTSSSLETFLGDYIPPEQLTADKLEAVGAKGKAFAAAIADGEPLKKVIGDVLANLVQSDWDDNSARGWTKGVAEAFLEPFGLGDLDNSTVTAMGTRGGVHQRVMGEASKHGMGVYSACHRPEMPFPILTQCVMNTEDKRVYFPAEWTPLYCGVPVPVTVESTGHKYGGGWVEPIGLNTHVGKAPDGQVGPEGALATLHRSGHATLAEAVGISSGYISYKFASGSGAMNKIMGSATQQYFNQQDWTCHEALFTDGGGTDYLGIHPLLRRKVKKVLACVATSWNPAGPKDAFATQQSDISGLFGRCPGGKDFSFKVTIDEFNAGRRVFDPAGWDAMWDDISAKFAAGGPAWHRAKYVVAENRFLGIAGGWEVEVLFVFNAKQANWEAALPEETRAKLSDDRTGFLTKASETVGGPLVDTSLRSFPTVSTTASNYSPELVVMLSNHAAWAVTQLVGEIKEMIAGA